MAKRKQTEFSKDFAFYQQLKHFYQTNRGKIRSRYKELSKKFLAYNDVNENTDAFLRLPQFEALEMYVFIKEFMDNQQVYEMFDDWRNRKGKFSESSYYAIDKYGQTSLFDLEAAKTDLLFKQMKKYKESYSNYIYALTMGLGKTILMATCIFYDFLLANKYPKDKRFCHNALVFAPDKTVLESLREIMTFDKTKVVPPEYARVLDANIKYHFMEESGTTLGTLDGSDFNIVISNTQKIIVKKKRTEDTPVMKLFNTGSVLESIYGDVIEDDAWDDASLMSNQRFKKLCRLPQLGVYVDEAHHLFGSDLEKQIRSDNGKKTSLRDTINLLAESTSIVACYNYTGTPYVDNQILPEVVYAYGLKESIRNGYLKQANPMGYENVKGEEFIRDVVEKYWEKYGDKTFEGLPPKLAIFASTIEEAIDEVRPLVETVLSELGISDSKILVNVGDEKITKDEDIKNFNDLDVIGTQGSQKQFLILVGKGREGWNCRSLLAVAMYRSPKSKVFVLQATMRCLRKLTDEQLEATVFLSKENFNILNEELDKNFNMTIKDLSNRSNGNRKKFKVKVLPPPRTIRLKSIRHKYSLIEKTDRNTVDYGLDQIDFSKYEAKLYYKKGITSESTIKEKNIDAVKEQVKFSKYTLTAEVAKYLNRSCIETNKILTESKDGIENILRVINKYNDVLYDIVIPKTFSILYEVKSERVTEDKDVVLLRDPENAGYYEFSADEELVIRNNYYGFTKDECSKTFHADTYCFDSKPEKELFLQYVKSKKVDEVYFTGMFTSKQGDLSIQYYDPESRRIRNYYPDFLAKMNDGSYQLIEVKGDNMIDDSVVQAKKDAATELAVASGIDYVMYPGSKIMKTNVLEEESKYDYEYEDERLIAESDQRSNDTMLIH